MGHTVITKVVTKGTLGQLLVRVNCSADTEVCLVVNRQGTRVLDHANPFPGEDTGKSELGHAFWKWHDCCQHHGRCTSHEDIYPEGNVVTNRCLVVDPDATVDLVMQANFPVLLVLSPRDLDAIHAEIRTLDAGLICTFGVDLGERDKGSTIPWPADKLR